MNEIEKRQFEADLAKRGLELGEHVRLARVIQAPAADVWKVISKGGQLNKYHPYCQENKVFRWPGVGSKDAVLYYSGLYFERDFMYWREGEGYDLQIGPPPRKTAWISWNIRPLGDAECELSLMVTPLLESHLLEAAKKAYVQTYFGKSIEIYLDSLLRGAEYFVMTGKEVRPAQYGTHPVYAPQDACVASEVKLVLNRD
jgi:ribosome-associated toxin RatA of RatAB toxin-antitoxin module